MSILNRGHDRYKRADDLTAFTIPLPLFPRIIEWYTKVRELCSLRWFADVSSWKSSGSPLIPQASFRAHCTSSPLSAAFYTNQPQMQDGILYCSVCIVLSHCGSESSGMTVVQVVSWARSSREYQDYVWTVGVLRVTLSSMLQWCERDLSHIMHVLLNVVLKVHLPSHWVVE